MAVSKILPSYAIQEFLNAIRDFKNKYQIAYDAVGIEDKRLQDLLHELEFTENSNSKNKVATKLKNSRKVRRTNKDTVLLLENLVLFFEDPQNKKVLDQLTQLLGKQRKVEEKIILSDRKYYPRVKTDKV